MGIDLIPENKQIEEEHYCYIEWEQVFDFLEEHCRQLFTEDELVRAYLSDGLEVPEWKATEMSLLLITLNLLTKGGGAAIDRFHAFCRDSQGFKIC